MRTFAALVTIAAFFAPIAPADAQVTTQKGFLKSSVEKFDGPDRSELLAFLAEARKISDSVAKALSSDNLSKASKMASPNAAKQLMALAEELKSRRREESSTTLQYRNQALELVGTEEARTSRVWYGLISTTSREATSFVSVVVEQTSSGHAGRVTAIDRVEYLRGVPPWLQSVGATITPPQ